MNRSQRRQQQKSQNTVPNTKIISVSQAKNIFKNSLFSDSTIDKYLGILPDKDWQQLINAANHYTNEWKTFKNMGFSIDDYISGVFATNKQNGIPDTFVRIMFLFMSNDLKTRCITNDMLSQMTILKSK
jgi:hypothetical protein